MKDIFLCIYVEMDILQTQHSIRRLTQAQMLRPQAKQIKVFIRTASITYHQNNKAPYRQSNIWASFKKRESPLNDIPAKLS